MKIKGNGINSHGGSIDGDQKDFERDLTYFAEYGVLYLP
jgi:hypothetical protein